uniref:uncharacterized protein LOC120336498 n=1 Tax=Styela clava TaxID=7725 RepID=UPI00193A2375|nr:uncharacterized protein LOC120336498 [Styela clava]
MVRPRHPAIKYKPVFQKLGICQTIIGLINMILAVISTILSPYCAIAIGVLYLSTGLVASSTSRSPTNCNVIGGMILAILSILASGGTTALYICLFILMGGSPPAPSATEIGLLVKIGGFTLNALELILAIVHSVYCCKGGCICCRKQQHYRPQLTTNVAVITIQQSSAELHKIDKTMLWHCQL